MLQKETGKTFLSMYVMDSLGMRGRARIFEVIGD